MFLNESDRLWANIIKSKYGGFESEIRNSGEGFESGCRQLFSKWWKNMMSIEDARWGLGLMENDSAS